jgi:ribosomal protein L29
MENKNKLLELKTELLREPAKKRRIRREIARSLTTKSEEGKKK